MIGGSDEYLLRMIPRNIKKTIGENITDTELLELKAKGFTVDEIATAAKLPATMTRIRLRRAEKRARAQKKDGDNV